jgi:hypothetical protein
VATSAGHCLPLDTGAAIADLLQGVQISKQPIASLDDIAGNIERGTRQEVRDAGQLLLKADRLGVSVVGQPSQTKVYEAQE